MNSREKILDAIKINKPEFISLQEWNEPDYFANQSLVEDFIKLLQSIHTTVKHISSEEGLAKEIDEIKSKYDYVINTIHLSEDERKNIQQFKPSSQLDWASGWIGTIRTIQCLMKIIMPFGIF